MTPRPPIAALGLLLALSPVLAAPPSPVEEAPAAAQPRQPPAAKPAEEPRAPAAAPLRPKTPADSVTRHSVAFPDRRLSFKASVSTLHLVDAKGEPRSDVVAVAYQLEGADPAKRPVTFVFNGGPGAASAYLQLGALGPWRVPLDFQPSSSAVLIDNADTWLDFTDLVFIDPPGTGYSRIVAAGEEARKATWSIEGDIITLASTVRRWLAANERFVSPKFVVGESYGGFRGPRVGERLATKEGVGVSGLVLISPVFDFVGFAQSANSPMSYAVNLPSFAAAARGAKGPVTRADLADAEEYALGDYSRDFLRGVRDEAAIARMADRVSALTGLDRELVLRLRGRVTRGAFGREFARVKGKVVSAYDGSAGAFDPEPENYRGDWLDPAEGLKAPITAAAVDLYGRRLGWKTEERYELINDEVNHGWDWGRDLRHLESMSPLRRILALDPKLRVLVAHGLMDNVTPYFATKVLLDQLPDFGAGAPGRVTLAIYPGGHMFYTLDESRKALRRDARALIEGK